MQKLKQSIIINAPRQKVWDTMLSDATYRDWTSAFSPGSYYKGEWKTGSKMLFIGPAENGGEMGMVSRIAEARPYEFVSIEHLGIFANGVEDTTSDMAKKWSPAFENYTFTEEDGGTKLDIELDVMESEMAMMEDMWKKALPRLKELAEKN